MYLFTIKLCLRNFYTFELCVIIDQNKAPRTQPQSLEKLATLLPETACVEVTIFWRHFVVGRFGMFNEAAANWNSHSDVTWVKHRGRISKKIVFVLQIKSLYFHVKLKQKWNFWYLQCLDLNQSLHRSSKSVLNLSLRSYRNQLQQVCSYHTINVKYYFKSTNRDIKLIINNRFYRLWEILCLGIPLFLHPWLIIIREREMFVSLERNPNFKIGC